MCYRGQRYLSTHGPKMLLEQSLKAPHVQMETAELIQTKPTTSIRACSRGTAWNDQPSNGRPTRPELLAISKGKDFLIVLLSISRDMGRLVAIETDHQQRIVTVARAHQAIDPLRTKAPRTRLS